MSKASIWNYLKTHTQLPDEAIAGIMGNFEAESNCEACRVQGDFSADRHVSKEYAAAINNGTKSIETAAHDDLGWGLAQWTFAQRKVNCFNACRSYGVGIEDESAQLAFFLAEIQMEFVATWNNLLRCHSIYDAASLVCCDYELPDVNNIQIRAQYGQQIYNEFHGKDVTPDPEPTPTPEPDPDGDKLSRAINLLLQAITLLKEIVLSNK